MTQYLDSLRRLEAAVGRADLDFSGRLVAVNALADQAGEAPGRVHASTVAALSALLHDGRHRKETQVLSLYRAAAAPLAAVVGSRRAPPVARRAAADALTSAMNRGAVHARRAAAEALGGLPLAVRGPAAVRPAAGGTPQLRWEALLKKAGVASASRVAELGRSRVVSAGPSRLLVVKEADSEAGGRLLAAEAAWMVHLAGLAELSSRRFDIPLPLRLSGGHLFHLKGAGANRRRAIAFFAHRDYFRYPNEAGVETETLLEVLERCSWLLGRLTAAGIVHTAPIPLFHNRAQAWRRTDGGIYEWPRAGRLDRWLASSRYPNLSAAGLRDFEHLTPLRRSGKQLFGHIGSHLLSMLLVAASYFRNQHPERIGYDAQGLPHDARDLYDPALLKRIIRSVWSGYFSGFVGRPPEAMPVFDLDRLVCRMIEEMGVDRHMEEIFRAADQKRVSPARFRRILSEGGLCRDRIEHAARGRQDIPLATGPHLGGFNGRISVPELIDFIQRAAALCICERFWTESEAACSGPG